MVAEQVDLNHLLQIIRAEYLEMPGLQLTKPQIQRLWDIDAPTCDVVLNTLECNRFLRRSVGNSYVRADLGF
jgi:hypothetical protein